MKKGSRFKTRPSQSGFKNVHSPIFVFILDFERPAAPFCELWKKKKAFKYSLFFFLEFRFEHIQIGQIGCDVTFGAFTDYSRWSPELSQRKNKYLKGFQIYNFGLGLGGILHWKIWFSSCSLWRQLLTYSEDPGTGDGQRTSIKWRSSYFLHLFVLLLQLLRYFLP